MNEQHDERCRHPDTCDAQGCHGECTAEGRNVAADEHYNELKNSGELERRRVAFAHRLDDPWSRR